MSGIWWLRTYWTAGAGTRRRRPARAKTRRMGPPPPPLPTIAITTTTARARARSLSYRASQTCSPGWTCCTRTPSWTPPTDAEGRPGPNTWKSCWRSPIYKKFSLLPLSSHFLWAFSFLLLTYYCNFLWNIIIFPLLRFDFALADTVNIYLLSYEQIKINTEISPLIYLLHFIWNDTKRIRHHQPSRYRYNNFVCSIGLKINFLLIKGKIIDQLCDVTLNTLRLNCKSGSLPQPFILKVLRHKVMRIDSGDGISMKRLLRQSLHGPLPNYKKRVFEKVLDKLESKNLISKQVETFTNTGKKKIIISLQKSKDDQDKEISDSDVTILLFYAYCPQPMTRGKRNQPSKKKKKEVFFNAVLWACCNRWLPFVFLQRSKTRRSPSAIRDCLPWAWRAACALAERWNP